MACVFRAPSPSLFPQKEQDELFSRLGVLVQPYFYNLSLKIVHSQRSFFHTPRKKYPSIIPCGTQREMGPDKDLSFQ
jgi:hypothetical protein